MLGNILLLLHWYQAHISGNREYRTYVSISLFFWRSFIRHPFFSKILIESPPTSTFFLAKMRVFHLSKENPFPPPLMYARIIVLRKKRGKWAAGATPSNYFPSLLPFPLHPLACPQIKRCKINHIQRVIKYLAPPQPRIFAALSVFFFLFSGVGN